MIRSTGDRFGSPTPAMFAMTRGFHEPLPFPRSGWPSGKRGVSPGGVAVDPGRSPILPAMGAVCPDARQGNAARSIAAAATAVGVLILRARHFEQLSTTNPAAIPPA